MIDCNEWKWEKRHESANMGKVKRLELWWQLYRTSLPVRDLENFRSMDFCSTDCTLKISATNFKNSWKSASKITGGSTTKKLILDKKRVDWNTDGSTSVFRLLHSELAFTNHCHLAYNNYLLSSYRIKTQFQLPGFYGYNTDDRDMVNLNSISVSAVTHHKMHTHIYEGWNFNSGNYLFTTDTK